MSSFPYLSVLTVAPLVGAAVVALMPRDRPVLAKQVALGWSLAVLVLTGVLWAQFKAGGARFQLRESYRWIPAWNARFTFEVDGIALVMLALIAVLVPLVVLAIGSLFAGWLMTTSVKDWLNPLFGKAELPPVHMDRAVATTLTLLFTLGGLGLGVLLFRRGTALEPQPAGPVVTAARNNLYFDTVNEVLFEMPGKYLTRALVYFDNRGIDGIVNGMAATVGGGSGRLRRLQTGFVRSYALSMLGGALLVVAAMLVVTLG